MALTSAIEPLRVANQIHGTKVFKWTLVSMDGREVIASNGNRLIPSYGMDDIGQADVLFVCGGLNIERTTDSTLVHKLRLAEKRIDVLGALGTAVYSLAKAGLLNHYKAAVHWTQKDAMGERFPSIDFQDHLFCRDRNRLTCTDGIAAMHLVLHLVCDTVGRTVATATANHLALDRIHGEADRQYVPLSALVSSYCANLAEATALMEANLEEPLTISEISKMVGISRRQVERLFDQYVHETPTKYYLKLRLQRAKQLLRQTPMAVMQIAVACGFKSAPHFSKSYRDQFDSSPTGERAVRRTLKESEYAVHRGIPFADEIFVPH